MMREYGLALFKDTKCSSCSNIIKSNSLFVHQIYYDTDVPNGEYFKQRYVDLCVTCYDNKKTQGGTKFGVK
jgi:hypothetical protein